MGFLSSVAEIPAVVSMAQKKDAKLLFEGNAVFSPQGICQAFHRQTQHRGQFHCYDCWEEWDAQQTEASVTLGLKGKRRRFFTTQPTAKKNVKIGTKINLLGRNWLKTFMEWSPVLVFWLHTCATLFTCSLA